MNMYQSSNNDKCFPPQYRVQPIPFHAITCLLFVCFEFHLLWHFCSDFKPHITLDYTRSAVVVIKFITAFAGTWPSESCSRTKERWRGVKGQWANLFLFRFGKHLRNFSMGFSPVLFSARKNNSSRTNFTRGALFMWRNRRFFTTRRIYCQSRRHSTCFCLFYFFSNFIKDRCFILGGGKSMQVWKRERDLTNCSGRPSGAHLKIVSGCKIFFLNKQTIFEHSCVEKWKANPLRVCLENNWKRFIGNLSPF